MREFEKQDDGLNTVFKNGWTGVEMESAERGICVRLGDSSKLQPRWFVFFHRQAEGL